MIGLFTDNMISEQRWGLKMNCIGAGQHTYIHTTHKVTDIATTRLTTAQRAGSVIKEKSLFLKNSSQTYKQIRHLPISNTTWHLSKYRQMHMRDFTKGREWPIKWFLFLKFFGRLFFIRSLLLDLIFIFCASIEK